MVFVITGRQKIIQPKAVLPLLIARNLRDRENVRITRIAVSRFARKRKSVARETARATLIAVNMVKETVRVANTVMAVAILIPIPPISLHLTSLTKNNRFCQSQNIPIFRVYFDFFYSILQL